MTEAEELELLELEEEEALAMTSKEPVAENLSALQYAGGLAQSIGQGYIPFYDEIGSGIRAVVDPTLYGEDRSIGERYDLSQEQAKGGLQRFRQANPNTSFAAEATAGFASPINKIGNVGQVGEGLWNATKSLGRNIARNATEGGIYGYGFGEGDNRAQSATDAAALAALFTAGLDTAGKSVGKLADNWKLPNQLRADIPVPDVPGVGKQAAIRGEETPLHIANPKSVRAGIMRQGVGRIPGANEALVEQSVPAIKKAKKTYSDREADFIEQGRNLDTHQSARGRDIGLDQQARIAEIQARETAETRGITERANQESRRIIQENNQAVDSINDQSTKAGRAIDEREYGIGLEQARASDEAARFDVERQRSERIATENARDALNVEVLQNSVPADRRGAVTEGGTEGYNQALKEVNSAYDDAFNGESLTAGTMDSVVAEAKAAARMVGEADDRLLKRIIADAEKIQKSGGNVAVLDEQIRNAINSSQDQIVRADLESLRKTLREGLTPENQIKLKAVDDVYPNLLTAERAAYASRGRVPTPAQLESSSAVVAGQRRTAKGEAPMMERIQQDIDTSLPPIEEPIQKAGGLEQARQFQLERQRLAETTGQQRLDRSRSATEARTQVKEIVAAEREAAKDKAGLAKTLDSRKAQEEADILSTVNKYEKQRLADDKKATLDPLREARDETLKYAKIPNESLYMAALLSGMLPGSGALAPKSGSIIGLSRKLASPTAQRILAGQGNITTKLIDYLQSGRYEYVTRAASLAATKAEEDK